MHDTNTIRISSDAAIKSTTIRRSGREDHREIYMGTTSWAHSDDDIATPEDILIVFVSSINPRR